MRESRLSSRTRLLVGLPVVSLIVFGCDVDTVAGPAASPTGEFAVAYGTWTPAPEDTCSADVHDRYSVVGPDGKLYPTWHPPVDPQSGCTFGHEHGRDPRGSDLYREVGPIPFALANEMLDIYDPSTARHEDHFGHKVEWENDIQLNVGGAAAGLIEVTCDLLTKLHQGTHSKDAFTNNMHEVVYHIRCSDGTGFSLTFMAVIGRAGEFVSSCDRSRHIQAGTPSPPTSPDGGGARIIPERSCVERHMLVPDPSNSNFSAALRESWEISGSLRRQDGKTLASFNPYYQVMSPSRFFDAAQDGLVGRPVAVCFEALPDGRRAQGELCRTTSGVGTVLGIGYDSPESRFNGVERFVDINSNNVRNADGPEIWYSDPFGRNARAEPFPGSIRQWVSQADNSGIDTHGPVIGRNRNYGGPGVHAPN